MQMDRNGASVVRVRRSMSGKADYFFKNQPSIGKKGWKQFFWYAQIVGSHREPSTMRYSVSIGIFLLKNDFASGISGLSHAGPVHRRHRVHGFSIFLNLALSLATFRSAAGRTGAASSFCYFDFVPHTMMSIYLKRNNSK